MISKKRRKTWKVILFIVLVLWFLGSVSAVYRQFILGSLITVDELSQQIEEMTKMAQKNMDMAWCAMRLADDLATVVQEWRELAYCLNAEIAMETERRIRDEYQKGEEIKYEEDTGGTDI